MQDWSETNVEEYTSPCPITIERSAGLDVAMALMQENTIRHLPVVDGSSVVGIISERDLLPIIGKEWSEMLSVSDIMNEDLLTVQTTDNLGMVAFALSSEKKGSAIVLDKEQKLYGIFTTTDALNALVEIAYPINRRNW